LISIQKLHKSFGTNHVLRGIDLTFDRPGVTAVLGPNGSGKTTIIKSILGMALPDDGAILIQGESIKGKWLYRNQIAYLPQIARFPENLTVNELLRMVKDLNSGKAHDEEMIALFDLHPFLDKRLGNLSGGTRQKVNLVLTFMYDCPIIILDEPTAGLDPISMVRLKELINHQRLLGKTILITTHVMSLVEELAEEVVFLLEGQIHFRGSLKDLNEISEEPNVERAIAKLLEKRITEMAVCQ
jgi:Cu-processing system ATP-binding protein